jgi:hypothetical protein
MRNHFTPSSGRQFSWKPSVVLLLVIACGILSTTGCVRLAANMLYAIRGNDSPAEYDDLKESRIAVVCSTTGTGASEAVNSLISSNIISALSRNLTKADLVKQEDMDRFMEMEGWSDGDPLKLAKGVRADHLVVIAVDNLKLRDGATLFRGQCDIHVKVYDMKNGGRVAFEKEILEHSFPRNGGTPITDTTETKFRSTYLQLVSHKISSLFHPVDPTLDVALDATASRF